MLNEELLLQESGISRLREIQRAEGQLFQDFCFVLMHILNDDEILREKKRNLILRRRRLGLDEVGQTFKIVTLEKVKELALQLKKPNSSVSCLKDIQRALLYGEQHIETFVRVEGSLFALVGKLICTDALKILEAASCIVNLTCGPHSTTYKVAKAAGAYLVTYIQGSSCNLQDLCSWAVGNIINDCECCFALLKEQGCLPALVSLVKSPFPEVVHSAMYALHACSKYKDLCNGDLLQLMLPEQIVEYLFCSNLSHPAVVDALFCLSNLCCLVMQEKSLEFQEKMGDIALNYLEKAVSKESFNVQVATALMHCLCSMSSGSDEICAILIVHEKFEYCVRRIIESQFQHLKKELLWTLSNFIASKNLAKSWQIDFSPVISPLRSFLSPLDTGVLPALYFLCVFVNENQEAREILKNLDFYTDVKPLLSCGNPLVEQAAQTFLSF